MAIVEKEAPVENLDYDGLAVAVRAAMRTMSPEDVSDASGGAVSPPYVREIRNGVQRERTPAKLKALSRALGKPDDWAHSILHGEPVSSGPASPDAKAWDQMTLAETHKAIAEHARALAEGTASLMRKLDPPPPPRRRRGA